MLGTILQLSSILIVPPDKQALLLNLDLTKIAKIHEVNGKQHTETRIIDIHSNSDLKRGPKEKEDWAQAVLKEDNEKQRVENPKLSTQNAPTNGKRRRVMTEDPTKGDNLVLSEEAITADLSRSLYILEERNEHKRLLEAAKNATEIIITETFGVEL